MTATITPAAAKLLRQIAQNQAQDQIDVTTPAAQELLALAYIAIQMDHRGSAAYRDGEPMRWIAITDGGREWLRLHP